MFVAADFWESVFYAFLNNVHTVNFVLIYFK